jgi:hypothetical protein
LWHNKKGQGDTLSEKQKEWLDFLCEIGIDAYVLHIGVSDIINM